MGRYECGVNQLETKSKFIMSKFITGEELIKAVDTAIWEAKEELMIVSPYIKLDEHFKKLFEKQLHNHELHILLMFGKNEGRVNKSFNRDDLEYFKQFPNISIIYVPNLHAKYYANEKMGVVTSINLYDYSFVNNIEFGVLYDTKSKGLFSKSTDVDVWNTCLDLANTNIAIFINRPMYADYKYRSSRVLYDQTDELYSGKIIKRGKSLEEFEDALDYDKVYSEMPSRSKVKKESQLVYEKPKASFKNIFEPGYCIRTGVKIPFNTDRPLSKPGYKSWSEYENEEYPEKYCHFSGEPSNGETSFSKPILRKNWKKAQKI
jgi:hypothetical protein